MSDVVRRWRQTAQLFSRHLESIGPEQWAIASPCSDWDVRQLVEHAVGTQAYFASMLGVKPAANEWDNVRTAMEAVFADPNSLEVTVDVPGLGPMPATQIVEICINDLLLHTWDVARSIGTDETLPEPLASACLAWLKGLPEAVLRTGRYAEALPIDEAANVQAQMLAFAGRQP